MIVLCPTCKGSGYILIARKGGDHLETCPTCKSTGRVGK